MCAILQPFIKCHFREQFHRHLARRLQYKTVKDKLRSTGFGKGGDPDEDAYFNEQSDPKEFIPQNFNDIDEVLGGRESVDP